MRLLSRVLAGPVPVRRCYRQSLHGGLVGDPTAHMDSAHPAPSRGRTLLMNRDILHADLLAGTEVAGPTLALVMTMAGRRACLDQLEGPGQTVAGWIG